MNLGKRFATALDMTGQNVPDLCRSASAQGVTVKPPTINALIRRDSNRSEALQLLLPLLDGRRVNVEWVRTGRGTPEPSSVVATAEPWRKEGSSVEPRAAAPVTVAHGSEGFGLAAAPLRSWEHTTELPAGDWVFIPKLGVLHDPSAKNGIRIVPLKEEVQAFRTGWIREDQLSPSALAWYDAIDDSMEPVICTGDSYVVDTSQKFPLIDGKTYAIWYGSAVRPRIVQALPTGGYRLTAKNEKFPSVDLSAQEIEQLNIVGRVVRREGRGGL